MIYDHYTSILIVIVIILIHYTFFLNYILNIEYEYVTIFILTIFNKYCIQYKNVIIFEFKLEI